MNEKVGEEISAYVDGELGSTERRFLAKRLHSDASTRETLARYQTISAVMRGEYASGAEQLGDRVSAALEEESAHEGNQAEARWQRLRPWLQPVAGVAIAASVAAGFLTVWPMLSGVDQGPTTSPEVAMTQVQAVPSERGLERVASEGTASGQAGALDAGDRRRLNAYFVNHSEHAAGGQLGGTLKYARIVGHGSDK